MRITYERLYDEGEGCYYVVRIVKTEQPLLQIKSSETSEIVYDNIPDVDTANKIEEFLTRFKQYEPQR